MPQDAKLRKPVKDHRPCPPKRMYRKIKNAFELFKLADELQLTDEQIIKLRAFYKKYYSEEAKKKEVPFAPQPLNFYEMNEQQLLKYADDEAAKVKNKIINKLQKIIEIKKILTKEQLEKIRKEFEANRKSDKPQDVKKRAGLNKHHKNHFSHQPGMMWPFMNPMFPPRPGMMCPQMHPMYQPHSSIMPPMNPMCPPRPGMMRPQMCPPRPGMMYPMEPQSFNMMSPTMKPMCPPKKRGMKPGKMGPMNPMFGPQMCPMCQQQFNMMSPMMKPMGPMGQPQFGMMPPFYRNQNCCPFSKGNSKFENRQFKERPPFFEHIMKLFSCKNDKDSDIIHKDKMNKGLPQKDNPNKDMKIPERK